MMNKQRLLAHRLLILLSALILLAVLLSWMAGALGFEVGNLMSGEGLRWWFRLTLPSAAATRLEWAVMAAVVLGAWERSGLASAAGRLLCRSSVRHRGALVWSALLWVVLLALLALMLLPQYAPLRSVAGRVWPSPFFGGLLRYVAFTLWVVAVCFGVVSGHLRGRRSWVILFYVGVQRYAPWLGVWLLVELLLQVMTFITS